MREGRRGGSTEESPGISNPLDKLRVVDVRPFQTTDVKVVQGLKRIVLARLGGGTQSQRTHDHVAGARRPRAEPSARRVVGRRPTLRGCVGGSNAIAWQAGQVRATISRIRNVGNMVCTIARDARAPEGNAVRYLVAEFARIRTLDAIRLNSGESSYDLAHSLGNASHEIGKHAAFAEFWFAKRLDMVSESMCQRHQQAIVGHTFVFERTAHAESQSIADQHEGNIV